MCVSGFFLHIKILYFFEIINKNENVSVYLCMGVDFIKILPYYLGSCKKVYPWALSTVNRITY